MRADIVEKALSYPFAPPDEPYVFDHGATRPFDPARDAALLADRVAVLAIGSNASPRRLAEKFTAGAALAVTRADVLDHVVAHSAKFAAYGSIPATLHPWPGARARVHVTWLDADQLAVMDRTETLGVEYDRVPLTAAHDAGRLDAQTYVSRAGALSRDGAPILTAAARHAGADGLTVLDQRAAQAFAMALVGGGEALEAFVVSNVVDAAVRKARSAALTAAAGLPYGRARS